MTCAAAFSQAGLRESIDLWDMAKARILDNLDEEEKTLFQEVDDQKMSKTRTALQNFQPLVSAEEGYGKALDAYVNIASLYLAPIRCILRVVLVMASSYGRFYSRMVYTFGRIGDIFPRFRMLPHLNW
jgi:hypothetical protein